MPDSIKTPVTSLGQLSYKNGGTGKGTAHVIGSNTEKFDENFEKIAPPTNKKCFDCKLFKGVSPLGKTNCPYPQQDNLNFCNKGE